ncbi:pentatricopeptide repeat-containing protein At4g39952, mitochondrial [Gastrolobium bilobum]|uniref:pentatricopeptide repeat-containing protein At4g39952, mitochondrial n=1 Tax=Gastrolobium bilobum TaxID=150636 RepID=UPI002AB0354D|nr:pentatricopeptide repeat-containing protein At4g39952, mitochondrial [Gastrolobium bilobum]
MTDLTTILMSFLLKHDHSKQLISLSKHITTIEALLQFHAVTVTTGNSTNLFISSKLISLYDSLNHPTSSSTLFHSLHFKDTFLWNSILKSHFSRSHFPKVLSFYSQMRASNVLPNHFTLPMVAAACAHLMLLHHGVNLHGLASKIGLFPCSSAVGSSFVSLYFRCGQMNNAVNVFDDIPVRDVIAWTALVIGYVQNGESEKGLMCLREMHGIGEDAQKPNSRTLEGGFLACGNLGALSEGRCLHGVVIKNGIECSEVIQSSILSLYCKCGVPQEAYRSFCELTNKDLLSWTSIIGVYTRFGRMTECVRFFWEMLENQIYPDGIVIGCILSGFGNSMNVSEGKAFHGLIIRRHYVADEIVNNSLLFMYCKFGMLSFAERLFQGCQQGIECWNFMVFGYGRIGKNVKCIELFREMQYLGIHSESISVVSAIASCAELQATNLGRSIHCNVIKGFMDDNVSVANSLIEMYGRCGKMNFAWRIFNMSERDVISWNTLISSHIHVEHYEEAINLFDKMIMEDQKPNTATFLKVLSACSHLASLKKGERVHHYINERGFKLNLPLGTALVDMYAKCGQLEKSRKIFDSIMEKDVICWNAMISGYRTNGYAESAVEIFQHMEQTNVKPNGITFLALLSACAHAGLVEEGKCLFSKMQNFSVKPNLKHYTCMVDLLGRSGNLQEAEALVLSMPVSPDGGVWGALLSACKTYNQVEMGIRIAMYAIDSEPENDGYYIMMANMYSSIGRWEEAENVRRTMKERCSLGKKAGWSVL